MASVIDYMKVFSHSKDILVKTQAIDTDYKEDYTSQVR